MNETHVLPDLHFRDSQCPKLRFWGCDDLWYVPAFSLSHILHLQQWDITQALTIAPWGPEKKKSCWTSPEKKKKCCRQRASQRVNPPQFRSPDVLLAESWWWSIAEHDGSDNGEGVGWLGTPQGRQVCLACSRFGFTQLNVYEVSLSVCRRGAGLKAAEDAESC